MLRIILLIAALGVVFYVIRRLRRIKQEKTNARLTSLEEMIRCAHCGTHFPKSEMITRAGSDYCCESHADLGPRT